MQPSITRRDALRVVGLGTGLAVVAACSPISPSSLPTVARTPAQKPGAAAAPQPKRGGTLRVGMVGDAARLDGQLVTTVDATWAPFDRLTSYDANLKPQPMLAESWEFSSDFTKLKLNLRKGVQFHSGRELTSEDIKWNVEYVRDPKVAAGALILQSNWFNSIETPDKYTVILGSDQPRPAVFDFFEFFDIVDKDTAPTLTTLVGTGPFKFVEWNQGDHFLFRRNENYWQSGLPYLDEVRISINADGQAMIVQLESGAIDVADGPPLADFARLAKDPNYQMLTVASGTNVIGVNTTRPPTDNKLVRQALNYALDRKRIVDSVYKGTGMPEALPWEVNSLAFDTAKNNAYAFDMDKARSLLNQAGANNLEFDLVTNTGNQQTDQLAQLYQANLATLGIKLNIQPYQTATYLDQINNHKYTGAYIGGIAYAAMEPVTRMANSRHLDPSGNSNTGFTSAQYVSLFNQASAEPDAAKRKALYEQVNALLLEESFVMPINSAPARMLARSSVHDIGLSQHGAFLFNAAWMG